MARDASARAASWPAAGTCGAGIASARARDMMRLQARRNIREPPSKRYGLRADAESGMRNEELGVRSEE